MTDGFVYSTTPTLKKSTTPSLANLFESFELTEEIMK